MKQFPVLLMIDNITQNLFTVNKNMRIVFKTKHTEQTARRGLQ